jgi:hypothetical protein
MKFREDSQTMDQEGNATLAMEKASKSIEHLEAFRAAYAHNAAGLWQLGHSYAWRRELHFKARLNEKAVEDGIAAVRVFGAVPTAKTKSNDPIQSQPDEGSVQWQIGLAQVALCATGAEDAAPYCTSAIDTFNRLLNDPTRYSKLLLNRRDRVLYQLGRAHRYRAQAALTMDQHGSAADLDCARTHLEAAAVEATTEDIKQMVESERRQVFNHVRAQAGEGSTE